MNRGYVVQVEDGVNGGKVVAIYWQGIYGKYVVSKIEWDHADKLSTELARAAIEAKPERRSNCFELQADEERA